MCMHAYMRLFCYQTRCEASFVCVTVCVCVCVCVFGEGSYLFWCCALSFSHIHTPTHSHSLHYSLSIHKNNKIQHKIINARCAVLLHGNSTHN